MTSITVKVIADSISPRGIRITTMRLRYPRWIHAEGRTHRVLSLSEEEETRTPSLMEDRNLSRNAASSRAIPVKKMIEAIRADPAVPIYWGSNKPGMQAGEEIDTPVHYNGLTWSNEEAWLDAMNQAIFIAEAFDAAGYHKQIINRLLEPWMHIETLVTATEWSNFFALRVHEAAEPHIYHLAKAMQLALENVSTPSMVEQGAWHLPFVTPEDLDRFNLIQDRVRLSVARCAHLSYETAGDGEPIGMEQANRIYDKLLGSQPIHASPAEHQATPDGITYRDGYLDQPMWKRPELHGNFKGWIQYRKTLDGESA